MTTALRQLPRTDHASRHSPAEVAQRCILHNVSWETYEALLTDLAEEHVFLTYDQGTLELMSPLPKHEREGYLLSRLIGVYTLERDIPIAGFGRTTWRNKRIAKGLEADECFYIRNERLVRARDDIDLPKDPPPDLAIEVDITRSMLKKQKIYARLKIGELWRFEKERLKVFALRANRSYVQVTVSPNLPDLPLAEVERFMRMRHSVGETELLRLFREWVREYFGTSRKK